MSRMTPIQWINALDLAARDRFVGEPFYCAEWTRMRQVGPGAGIAVTTMRHHSPGATFTTVSDSLWRYRADRQGD